MAENNTKTTQADVQAFFDAIENPKKRDDCIALAQLMREVSGHEPRIWGDSMVGFGSYHYKYASGREGDSFLIGFSPRKQNITVYLMGLYIEHEGDFENAAALLDQLGKYKMGKSCLYIKSLSDVNTDVLKTMMQHSIAQIRSVYPDSA